jgi:hypothetical protein
MRRKRAIVTVEKIACPEYRFNYSKTKRNFFVQEVFTMTAQSLLRADPLPWLLEPDDPGPRYLALRDLCGLPADDPELRAARAAAHVSGPIATVLDAMDPTGFWVQPGPGYGPKYHSTVWAMILLGQLGAAAEADARVATACRYLLDHALTAGGQFSYSGAPSGTIDCLQGNLCAALLQLGAADPRLDVALDWLARSVTGEGIAPAGAAQPDRNRQAAQEKRAAQHDAQPTGGGRYYASLKCGPCFACRVNNSLPCAWGGVKVMLALAAIPQERRTPAIERAIAAGTDYLLRSDPATAAYPTADGRAPSRSWWSFGFPVFYVTDLLQLAEAMTALRLRDDPRLANLLALIADKQDDEGRWKLEYVYGSKTWGSFGRKGQSNKWVTLRAARVLDSTTARHCLPSPPSICPPAAPAPTIGYYAKLPAAQTSPI